MATKRQSEELTYTPRIDLSGPDGNAYCLLGYASRWGRELGKDTAAIHKEMTKGDYHNLVRVFIREFDEVADIIVPDDLFDDL
jgi:hypothetical protein